jgi:hypothetical protein
VLIYCGLTSRLAGEGPNGFHIIKIILFTCRSDYYGTKVNELLSTVFPIPLEAVCVPD